MSVCDVPVISEVCDVAGEGAATLVSAPFDWLASAMGEAAGWLMETMWTVFDSTTMVDLTGEGYLAVYNLVFGIGVMVVLIFFCLQLITGLIKRDPSALARAALGAAKSVLGSFLVITLTALLLEIVDQLSIGIIQAAGETTESMGDKIVLLAAGLTTINIAAPGVGAIITIFLAGLMIAAIAIVWFSLLIRKALLLIAIVLAPLAFAGAAWDGARGWIGKWVAFVIALAVSKLVLVIVFLIAITQMATPIEADLQAVTEPITGIVLMGIAAFAPYMVYRFISFIGFDLYNTMGAEQESKSAMNRPVPTPGKGGGSQGSGSEGGPQKIFGGKEPSGGAPAGGGAGKPTGGTGASAASGGAGAGGGGAGAGAAAGGGGASAGAGAAAGPLGAGVVIGGKVLKDAGTAGAKSGQQIGKEADTQAGAADQNNTPQNTTTGGSSHHGANRGTSPGQDSTRPQGPPGSSGQPSPASSSQPSRSGRSQPSHASESGGKNSRKQAQDSAPPRSEQNRRAHVDPITGKE